MAIGCSSSGDVPEPRAADEPREAATGTDDRTTTTEPTSVEDEIVARYIGFWDARFSANSPPDPGDPGLAEYATGEALMHAVSEAEANEAAGVEFRRRDEASGFQRVEVVEVSDDTAVVQECVVDDSLVIRSADGAVLNDVVASHNMRGEMRRVDGEWRLARSQLVQRWEGEAGCALAP